MLVLVKGQRCASLDKSLEPPGIDQLPGGLFAGTERQTWKETERWFWPRRSIDALQEFLTGAGIRGTSADLSI